MVSQPRVDVAIAGAGPAGAVAAVVLARAGARVQLIDRAPFPRQKLCGDTINPGAVQLLQRLGLADGLRLHGVPIDGMIVTGLYGVAVPGSYARNGAAAQAWSMTRRDFDAGLVEAAVEAGAAFDERVSVRGPIVRDEAVGPRVGGLVVGGRNGKPVQLPATVTIAADGRRSVLATTLGLTRPTKHPRRWVVGGYFAGVESLHAMAEMHIRRDHYIGVAPVPRGLANVCVVSPVRNRFARPTALLCSVVAADPVLKDRFAAARLVGPVVSLGPMGVDASAAGLSGLLLAGDAAGFIDPVTGDGVRFALRGGQLAARAALSMLKSGRSDGHEQLARWRAAEFGGKYRFNRAIRVLVGSRVGVSAGSLGAAVLPGVLRRVIAYAGDVDDSPPAG